MLNVATSLPCEIPLSAVKKSMEILMPANRQQMLKVAGDIVEKNPAVLAMLKALATAAGSVSVEHQVRTEYLVRGCIMGLVVVAEAFEEAIEKTAK